MRRFIAMVLVGSVCLLAACSYATDFVIVNESGDPVIVRYEIKDFPGPFYLPTAPGLAAASELSEDGQEWKPLYFEIDETSRSVTTQLMPGQALRIATMNGYSGHDAPNEAERYHIRRIIVSGPRGELDLSDEQARTSFMKVARTLYTLTYK